jgi:hypothetical protein
MFTEGASVQERSLKVASDELRKRAQSVANDRTREELLILAEQYEQLAERAEQKRLPYLRLPKSLFN